MFAILISEDNMPTIIDSVKSNPESNELNLETFLASARDWYFLTGYVPSTGGYSEWGILPAYIFENDFEYNPVDIKTQFDQTFRR